MVSTIDFFYPLVDDPYNQGMIGASNVLSDLYSCGVLEIPTVLMILSASTQMKKSEQLIVTKLMMKGFADKVREAGGRVAGGQSVLNEYPMIGGAAFGLVRSETPYVPKHAKPGDVLVLTKPLGSQILVNVNQYYMNKDEKFKTLFEEKKLITESQIEGIYERGLHYMSQLNRVAADLMLKHGATSSTDVTGFGIFGHSQNLAEVQDEAVDFLIDTLPTYPILHSLDKVVRDFKFKQGLAAETSGGLLISLPADRVDSFISEMHQANRGAWKVGKIIKGTRKAKMAENLKILEVN